MSGKFTMKQTPSGKYSIVDNTAKKTVSYNNPGKKKGNIDPAYDKVAGNKFVKKNINKFFKV